MFAPPTKATRGPCSTASTRGQDRARPGPRPLHQQDRRLQRHVRLHPGHVPRRRPPPVPRPTAGRRNASLRFYNDATLIHRYGDFTQTGDFFPALQQLAGATWQQVAAGGPDAYKVDCAKLETMWRDWFTALYTSAMEQGYGDYLLPYLAREVHGEWRLGANASGIICPNATDGSIVPLVTDGTFKTGALATAASRTPCMFTEGEVNGVRVDGNDLARKWLRDAKTGAYTAPPPSPYMNGKGRFCVPWPPGDLLLSKYRRADDAIITPAVQAVAQLQRRRLSAASTAPMCGPWRSTVARPMPHSPARATPRCATTASRCASDS
jgi:hypothetical protein